MEKKVLTVPTRFLSMPEESCIHSVIAPYIYIRSRMTQIEEALLDESLSMMCCTFTALRASRPPPIPLRHISSYMSMSYEFTLELLRTAEAMMEYTKSSEMELYFNDALKNEIYRCPRSSRESKHFVRHKIGPGTTLAAYVAYTKRYVFVNDLINDENYPKGLNNKESLAQRIMCIPVITPSNELVAVLQLSRDAHKEPYNIMELELCLNTCHWIGTTTERTHINLGMRKKAAMYDYFHNLLNAFLFEHIPFRQYISELLCYSAKVMNAQCSIFYMVSDNGGIHGSSDTVNYDMFMNLEKFFHFKKTSFGHNITTVASETRRQNKILNLGKDELFTIYNLDIYKPVVVTSSLAATSKGYAAYRGVAEMINKQDNIKFCADDELIFSNVLLHADYALSCHKLSEEIKKLESCLKTRNDTLQFLFEPCRHDKINYANIKIKMDPQLYSVNYTPDTECHLTLCKIIDLMFEDILHRWKLIPPKERGRFLLMVHKVSSSSEYLDFLKIFCSVHCVATIIKRCPEAFTEVEKELLMYSALCHQVNVSVIDSEHVDDLDMFPETTHCDYSSSFYYTKLIFKSCKIFSDEEENKQMLSKMCKLMEACYHNRVDGKIEKIVKLLANEEFNMKKQRHRHLMRICVMVVAGFAVHFKSFSLSVEYHIRKALESTGYFKKEHCDPSQKFKYMDRTELAISQRSFLDTVALPWAIILRTILPPTTSMIFSLVEERENWNEITKSNICKDFWIPLKIKPSAERNNDIILFLESDAKGCLEPVTSSAKMVSQKCGGQDRVEPDDDESFNSESNFN